MKIAMLVGEANPFGGGEATALWPHPVGSAGDRLRRHVLRVSEADYLDLFLRRNLFESPPAKWERSKAMANTVFLVREAHSLRVPVVALGRRVHQAFGLTQAGGPLPNFFLSFAPDPATAGVLCLPHPSGRCHAWNDPATALRCRAMLLDLLPQLKSVEVA